jgi:hypothetical protein
MIRCAPAPILLPPPQPLSDLGVNDSIELVERLRRTLRVCLNIRSCMDMIHRVRTGVQSLFEDDGR